MEGSFRGQNLTIEYHSADGDYARLPQLAADLVNRRVSLITAFGAPAALVAKATTATTPVVFAVSANPIQIGLVSSLDHPESNLTGVAGMAVERERGCTAGRSNQGHVCVCRASWLANRTRSWEY